MGEVVVALQAVHCPALHLVTTVCGRVAQALTTIGAGWTMEGVTTDEAPGGTVGCDVCGIELAADKVEFHRAWHHRGEERLDHLIRAVEELLAELRQAR